MGWEIHAYHGYKEIDSTIYFDFAELLALQGRNNEALDHLEKALENGYRNLPGIKLNPHIHLLHEEPGYQDLINEYFLIETGHQ